MSKKPWFFFKIVFLWSDFERKSRLCLTNLHDVKWPQPRMNEFKVWFTPISSSKLGSEIIFGTPLKDSLSHE